LTLLLHVTLLDLVRKIDEKNDKKNDERKYTVRQNQLNSAKKKFSLLDKGYKIVNRPARKVRYKFHKLGKIFKDHAGIA